MKARFVRYAIFAALSASVSACGPSKDTMCHEIAAGRNQPDLEFETYVKCLNLPDDAVRRMYKEMKERQQKRQ